ncbi:MAG: hypothetical protein ACXVNO_05995, partial [Bacteroidia bacterium]
MKKRLLEKSYQPFFGTGLFAAVIALFLKIIHPESIFDVSIYNMDIVIPNSKVWFVFSLYLFFLAGIYYVISRSRLRSKHWLVISHYVFIILFLVFFAFFSAFESRDVQNLIGGIPLSTLITIYGTIFLADVLFFFIGLLLLFVNLF